MPVRKRGSQVRVNQDGSFRDIVAVGGPTFTSIANAASSTLTYTFTEACVLDKLTAMAGAVVQLVAGGDSAERGSYLTAAALNGNGLTSGNVPLAMFAPESTNQTIWGHTVVPGVSILILTILNESGATLEYGIGYSVR